MSIDGEVNRSDLLAGFFLLLGMSVVFLLALSSFTQSMSGETHSQQSVSAAVSPDGQTGPPQDLYYNWGGFMYNYEWGWDNYATGYFELVLYVNGTPNSNGVYTIVNHNVVDPNGTNGASMSSPVMSGQEVYNATDRYVEMWTETASVTFSASDWLQSNSVTVLIAVNADSFNYNNAPVTGFLSQNGHTTIDWANILGLIMAVASAS